MRTHASTLLPMLLAAFPAAAQDVAPAELPFRLVGNAFMALSVGDMDESEAWYQAALGLTTVRSVGASEDETLIRVLGRDSLLVELIHDDRSLDVRELTGPLPGAHLVQGLFKAGFFVDDADALFSHLQSQGVTMDQRVIADPEMGLRFFVFRDLDGNRLQAFERCTGDCGGG